MGMEQKLPNAVMKNARFRGPRESEKYLNSHHEQLYDIRKNWKEIQDLKKEQDKKISERFFGKKEENETIKEITAQRSININDDKAHLTVISDMTVREVKSIMVSLSYMQLQEDVHYFLIDGTVFFLKDAIKSFARYNWYFGELILNIQMTADVVDEKHYNKGIRQTRERLHHIHEKMSELERRFKEYENAN